MLCQRNYLCTGCFRKQPIIGRTKRPKEVSTGKKAEELHRAANVALGPCGLNEIKTFEDFLNIQICVISADKLNQVSNISV